ncbi:hypothetical protein DSM3645_00165 [Blastopirellula marina DSM 3645]|uniref:Uncharacterized protein n=1 Tax=Blastopirellula marina DSM 3645 TaxID=314230 RepID=A3ZMB2_9BACT|nr:hypothetical protein DSM3645_00165 [Blastopirellula marina DSM 3645]
MPNKSSSRTEISVAGPYWQTIVPPLAVSWDTLGGR